MPHLRENSPPCIRRRPIRRSNQKICSNEVSSGRQSNLTMGLRQYVREHKDELRLKIIGAIASALVLGTLAVGLQEVLKKWLWPPEQTAAQVKLISSSFATFQGQHSFDVIQLLGYDVFASDLITDIKIPIIFKRTTEITRYNVLYSVDIDGFDAKLVQKNHLVLNLRQPLNVSRRATVYVATRRSMDSRENVTLELPDIHLEGQENRGVFVY